LSQMSEAGRIISMSELFHLVYVVRAHEDIQIVLDQFTEISSNRVVDGIIHYGGCTLVVIEPTLKERSMRDMYDSPLVGNSRYSYEYEAPKVTWILSKEVLRLHRLLEYVDGDRGSRFSSTVWQDPNRVMVT